MRVLYVEDHPMNRHVVHEILSAVGIDVVEAENGALGVECVDQSDAFDLVLMDLRMPVMDGLTAMKHIRERDDLKGRVPIIVVTADAELTLEQDCRDLGADEFMTKPLKVETLFESVVRLASAGRIAVEL
jgi:CheY-like chemotaxis protein